MCNDTRKPVSLEAYNGAVVRDVKVTSTPTEAENLASSDWNVELEVHLQAAEHIPQNGNHTDFTESKNNDKLKKKLIVIEQLATKLSVLLSQAR
jgi:hypothetical protein